MKVETFIRPLTLFESHKNSSLHECLDQAILSINSHNSILNLFSDAVLVKDVQSNFIGCNNKLAKITGFTDSNEIVGKSDSDMIWSTGGLHQDFLHRDNKLNKGFHQLNIGRYLYKDGLKTMMIRRFPLYRGDIIVGNITMLKELVKPRLHNIIDHAYEMGFNLNDNKVIDKIDQMFCAQPRLANINLTTREYQVIYHWVRGASADAIARRLNISIDRAKQIQAKIRLKFNCDTKEQLLLTVIDSGFIDRLR
jgi:DNA-binding CsgD family transcriptional regulator